jgi:hypothetical protein
MPLVQYPPALHDFSVGPGQQDPRPGSPNATNAWDGYQALVQVAIDSGAQDPLKALLPTLQDQQAPAELLKAVHQALGLPPDETAAATPAPDDKKAAGTP